MKKFTYFITVLALITVMISSISVYAVKHTVLVGNNFFNPASLNVSVGDTIRWQWSAGSHTTTSSTIPGGAAAWDELITSASQVYEYKVTVAGNYNYVCTPHVGAGMIASFSASAFVPTLSVAPSNRSVVAAAGSTTFTVTSNSSWTSSSNSGWCTVGSGGSGNGTLSANYSENTSVAQRVATITVMVAGLPDQTVTVTQAGAAPTLAVGPANQNVSAGSGSISFSVTSNTTWNSSSSASWCTAAPASGSGNGLINATFEANTTTQVRVATISVSVSGLPVQTVTVTQAASTVGIGDEALSQVKVFPNPTKGQFKVNLGTAGLSEAVVTLTDLSGKKILSRICSGQADHLFDISAQPRGYNFIRIETGGNSSVRKIVLID